MIEKEKMEEERVEKKDWNNDTSERGRRIRVEKGVRRKKIMSG